VADTLDMNELSGSSGLETIQGKAMIKELLDHGEETFRHRYPHPFLVLKHAPPKEDEWVDPKTEETDVNKIKIDDVNEPNFLLIRVVKSNRNVFESKITIGRAKNNDIIVRAPKISKLHAAFVKVMGDKFRLLDMGSSNGTSVNGERLKARKAVELEAGDEIVMWRYVFEYLDTEGILRRLKGAS
jgi:translation elongation factor P/translation initiation factor 5A